MSFRELKSFTEIMKSLGYPRLISVDNFRKPNFELVADILYWMAHRIDPFADISDDISTEDHRVKFLKSVATLILRKIQIRLKLKSLYRADGYAVKELLKIASLLSEANAMDVDTTIPPLDELEISNRMTALKQAQSLGSKIVESGAQLHDLLAQEKTLQKQRNSVVHFLDEMSYNIESDEIHSNIEQSIRQKINTITDDIARIQSNIEQLSNDDNTLSRKIGLKQSEMDRSEKRLRSLRSVKPAFMAEYETLEKDFEHVYKQWVQKYLNLSYLQSELDKYRALENEKKSEHEQQLKQVQRKLYEEELKALRGEDYVNDSTLDEYVQNVTSRSSRSSQHSRYDKSNHNHARHSRDSTGAGGSSHLSVPSQRTRSSGSDGSSPSGSNTTSGSDLTDSGSVTSGNDDAERPRPSSSQSPSMGNSMSDLEAEDLDF